MPRFRIEPRDIPIQAVARRLGKDVDAFRVALPRLLERGFPAADPDTGNFDLHAIDRWCDSRHSHLFGAGAAPPARNAGTVARNRIAAMRAGKQ